tara:strand:+ start:1238 stop:1345 length:108 start_codon:yes stop_codon:yes gene_type:complete
MESLYTRPFCHFHPQLGNIKKFIAFVTLQMVVVHL